MPTQTIEKENSKFTLGLKRMMKSENIGLIIAFFAIVLVFSILNPNYFSDRNMVNILTSASLTGLICVGESMLLIGGYMDLSPGSTAAFAGVAAALLLQAGIPAPITILLIILMGVFIGCCNAFFITQLKISAFIATLALQSIVRGFAFIISNGEGVLITNSMFLKMGTLKIFGVRFLTFPIFFMLLIFVVFGIVLKKTRFGREIYIVGGNPTAARLAGISTKKTTYKLFVNMSVLASVGGMILAARMNTGQPQACTNLEFDGITAAILGGVAMSGGFGSIFGAFIGLFILQGFNNGLIMLNVQSFWQNVAKGALLLLALSFDYLRSRKRANRTALTTIRHIYNCFLLGRSLIQ
ncbi:ABC transporter permease [Hydrogenoanaerobacterium sp.]|uniref:ABC transporter permease n=1 Tax=Hydrogenoanaerobacterium sp. TaxID=2953763 RepID=UPI00289F45AB|nr:ABC transporter permease [Hydrogenoanaerobacterium sp.]